MTESPVAEQMVIPSNKKRAMAMLMQEDDDDDDDNVKPLNPSHSSTSQGNSAVKKEKTGSPPPHPAANATNGIKGAGSDSDSDDEDMLILDILKKKSKTLPHLSSSKPSHTGAVSTLSTAVTIKKEKLPTPSSTATLQSQSDKSFVKTKDVVKIKKEEPVKVKKEESVKIKKEEPVKVKKEEPVKVKKEEPIKAKKETSVKMKNESSQSSPMVKKKIKKEADTEDEEADEEYRWWEDQQHDHTIKWHTLEHNGVYFPPDYVPHGIKMIYDGKPVDLTHDAEEVATFFAGVIGTPYADNPTFQKNFFIDFKKILEGTAAGKIIKTFEKCNFTPIADHLFALKESRKSRTKDEKEAEKKAKDEIQEKYGFCKLDGRKEKVGNFRVEPPGLFRGRGEHPKTGCLKTRVQPEQVTINLSKGAQVPLPPPGHSWAKIVHDNEVTWLANWVENVNGEIKYVFLAAGSVLKGKSDMKKFEKARELKKLVDHIRRVNKQELSDESQAIRQRATALWLIDHLALRAGNEKGDDEADTVGCCSLRVEHIRLEKPATVIFDFLGKDSIRYYNKVTVPEMIFKNLERFKASKSDSESLFDTLTTSSLNSYLTKLMPGLTAKVFRTFNASFTFQKELANTPSEGTVAEKILAYNRANRQVAVLCNHQRSVPKTHDLAMERLNDKIMTLKYERQLVRNELRSRVSSAKMKARTDDLANSYESDFDEPTMKAKTLEMEEKEKEKNAKLIETGKSPTKSLQLDNMADDKLEKKFENLRDKIAALRTQMIDKDEGKQTALGTSKINYIDPRISAAWCYSHDVPIEKIFNRSLREKFKWAMEVDAKWEF